MWEGATPYWTAFLDLNRARGHDMGAPEPITVGDTLAYARAFGFADSRTDLEEFADLMASLDRVMLDHAAAHAAAARQRTSPRG